MLRHNQKDFTNEIKVASRHHVSSSVNMKVAIRSIHLKKRLTKFLGKIYPHVDFKIVFLANKPIGSLFPLKIVSLVTFAPLLFISLHLVAARLLTMAKRHVISLSVVESI